MAGEEHVSAKKGRERGCSTGNNLTHQMSIVQLAAVSQHSTKLCVKMHEHDSPLGTLMLMHRPAHVSTERLEAVGTTASHRLLARSRQQQ